MTRKLHLILGCLVLSIVNVTAQLQSDEVFDYSVLHEIRIEFDEDDYWDILLSNYESAMGGMKSAPKGKLTAEEFYAHLRSQYKIESESKIPYLAGKVTFDGDVIEDVGVRLKGFSSYWGSEFKKSIKLDFNEFVDTQVYKGVKKLNLNNGEGDPSFQRDFISYYMMRKVGVAAPRVSFAKVYLNDKYWGLYSMVEQVDKTFLENNFASRTGNLYKAWWNNLEYKGDSFQNYIEDIELKTNEDKCDGSDYVNFVKSIAQLHGDSFNDSIQKLLHLDYFFKVLAIDVVSKNWDSFMMHGRNFYLYHEPVSDLFYWIPWDYNLAWDGTFFWGGEGEWENECDTNYTFTYDTIGTSVAYKLEANIDMLQYIDISYDDVYKTWWDFSGDDTTIIITDSTAIIIDTIHYDDKGIYSINLNIGYEFCGIYNSEKIITIDSADIKCKSIFTMNQPYRLDDVVFDAVFRRDKYCCDCQWDNMCASMYYAYPDTSVNSHQYPINMNPEKALLNKLLRNKEYKNRYYNAFKLVLDSAFNAEKLIGMINANTDLIREAVYADTNLIFSTNDFENDVTAFCEGSYQVTSLTRLIDNRKAGLDDEFVALNYQAQPVEREVHYNDVVINEFMTNRSDADTTYKSDWIELYNNTDDIIDLNGFWLSDRRDSLKYAFPPSAGIKPGGYVIVWADNSKKKNGLHAGFKLAAGGEDVLLYHEKYDTIDVVGYNYVFEDSTFARIPNGTGSFIIMHPTFNKNNESGRPVGTKDIKKNESLLAYPVPAKTTIYMKAMQAEQYRIEMFDTMGKLVLSKSNYGQEMSINVSSIPNGFYILKVKHGKQQYSSKVAVEH